MVNNNKKNSNRKKKNNDVRAERPSRNRENEVNSDMLEGRNSVLEAIKANRTINKLLVQKGDKEGSIKNIIALARKKGIVIQETDRINLDKISTTHAHQGVIAYVASKDYVEVDEI